MVKHWPQRLLGATHSPERETEAQLQVKEESDKAGLKLNIQKTKIMESGPITSWQTDGEKVETVTDFIFFGSKITVYSTTAMKLKDASSDRKSVV